MARDSESAQVDEFAHDRVTIRFHRIGRALAVGFLGAFAWGIRGVFGHELGAAIPGVLLGGGVAMLSGHDIFRNRQWAVAATGALSFAIGGAMSYGRLIGYTRHVELGSVVYGFLGLLLVGALWGLIGGAWVGLALARRLSLWKVITGVLGMASGALVGYGLLVKVLGLHLSPPRSDAWAAVLGAAVVLVLFLRRWDVPAANGGAVFGALGFGVGFVVGNGVQILGNVSGIPFDWWKAMEMSMGFIGGTALAWGIWLMGDLSKPIFKNPNLTDPEFSLSSRLVGWAVVFALIPAALVLTRLDAAELTAVAQGLGVQSVDAFVATRRLTAWGVLLIGLITVRWAVSHSFQQRRFFPGFPFLFALQVLIFAWLKYGFPVAGGIAWWVFGAMTLALILAVLLVVALEPTARVFHLHPPAPTMRFIGLLALAALVVTLAIAWLSTLLHGEPLPGAHLRW